MKAGRVNERLIYKASNLGKKSTRLSKGSVILHRFTMPLFSNRDPSEDVRQNGVGPEPEEGEQSATDEHTRLLPNHVNSTQSLFAPDDPAVSPYNLWSIRALRYLTIVFTLVTFIWWVLLLMSTFATPPGFQCPGSGWLAYNYASLALANLLFTLVFFGVPSKSFRMLVIFISVGFPLLIPS